VLIGLAVAVDYSLFMITRFRVERRAGPRPGQGYRGLEQQPAGRAVFFSGLAVMISLAGLITLGVSLFTSDGDRDDLGRLVSVIGSLTFLPATLSILGDRVTWAGRPPGSPASPRPCPSGRSAAGVGRHSAGWTIAPPGRRAAGSGAGS